MRFVITLDDVLTIAAFVIAALIIGIMYVAVRIDRKIQQRKRGKK